MSTAWCRAPAYGYRAHGRYAPDQGFWFDPSKLLVDPYAKEIDRPFAHDPRLSVFGTDTAALVPKGIVTDDPLARPMRPLLPKGGFIYEVAVKAFTQRHPEVPAEQRGNRRGPRPPCRHQAPEEARRRRHRADANRRLDR